MIISKEEAAKVLLKRHEGLRLKPYKCSAGKLTIGYGRNLDDNGVTKAEAELLFDRDWELAKEQVINAISFYNEIKVDARHILINMAFNMGIGGLLTFKKMLMYLEKKEYKFAADEMLNSKWAVQVGSRATDLAQIMRLL